MNITEHVINSLCAQSPLFKRFFDTHFEIIRKQSLVPKITDGKPTFPTKTAMHHKDITFEEKLRYYEQDINEWNREQKYFPKKYIMISFSLEEISGWE